MLNPPIQAQLQLPFFYISYGIRNSAQTDPFVSLGFCTSNKTYQHLVQVQYYVGTKRESELVLRQVPLKASLLIARVPEAAVLQRQ